MTNTQYFVKLGYGDMFKLGTRSLDFRTDEMEGKEACEVVKMIDNCNGFYGEEVAGVIQKIVALWPSTHQQVRFLFGREHSPVLYVVFPFWKSQTERFENREELILKSMNFLRSCQPDELDQDIKWYRVRAWWD